MTKFATTGVGAPAAGSTNGNSIFLIDFGLTTSQTDHSKYKFKGTPYFASNSALSRVGTGPKDDIESLLYILIYFFLGELPW